MTETTDLTQQREDETTDESDDALISRYVEEDRSGRGRHRSYVVVGDAWTPVWVLAGYVRYGGTPAQAAADYGLPEEAVMAALAYHARHRDVIDAWLTLNEESARSRA